MHLSRVGGAQQSAPESYEPWQSAWNEATSNIQLRRCSPSRMCVSRETQGFGGVWKSTEDSRCESMLHNGASNERAGLRRHARRQSGTAVLSRKREWKVADHSRPRSSESDELIRTD